MALYYFMSPHRQITEDFDAVVTKVVDGDTIRVLWDYRDFEFPVRFLGTNAPEMNEPGGREARLSLEAMILGEKVHIIVDPDERVGKWGRILGTIIHRGLNINEEMIRSGKSTTFAERDAGKFPDLNELFMLKLK